MDCQECGQEICLRKRNDKLQFSPNPEREYIKLNKKKNVVFAAAGTVVLIRRLIF
jgi:hypothetical protein